MGHFRTKPSSIAAAAFGGMLAWTLCAASASALDPRGAYVYVPNRASADITIIDTRSDAIVAHVPVGKVPHQVVVSDTQGKLVASNSGDNTISIIGLDDLRTLATVTLDAEPEHMALAPDGVTLAVGNIGAGTLSFVSLAEDRELARVDGLFEPHNMSFSPDGKLLYVANLGANHVSVIDVAAAKVVKEIPVAEPTPLAAALGATAEYQGIIDVTRTPDGRYGFAAHGEGNTLAVIDLRTQETIKQIALGELPWRAYSTADGRFMLVPNNGDETVSVISTATLDVVATLPGAADMTGINSGWFETVAAVVSRGESKLVLLDLVDLKPAGEIALPGTPETGVTTPDGRKLYVALSDSNSVAVVDLKQRALIKTIENVGEEPWGATMVGALNYCH